MAALPTRIRQHIRDHVTAETAPLTARLAALAALLGYPIALAPEWVMLWAALQNHYPDPATFVPAAVVVVNAWCEAVEAWLEDDANAAPVERLLDELKGWNELKIALEIAPTSTRPVTSWRGSKAAFVVGLPKAQACSASTAAAGFATDLRGLFTGSPVAEAADDGDGEAWADVVLLDTPAGRGGGATVVRNDDHDEEQLPDASALARPEELTRRPPYRIVVRQVGNARVDVQGSHAASLAVLEAYLKKWTRHAPLITNRPPVVEIRLRESPFGLGLLHDTLTLEGIRGQDVAATLVLVLVESVLGYHAVAGAGSAGALWEFRRTRPFR